MSHVLLVEDDLAVGSTLCAMLDNYGHRCSYVGNGADALAALERGGLDVVVTDLQLPGGLSGIQIAERAKALSVGCVVITGYGGIMSKLAQPCIWLSKPFRAAALADAVAAAAKIVPPPAVVHPPVARR
jgi:two-component system, cell cycle response regulator CpdR